MKKETLTKVPELVCFNTKSFVYLVQIFGLYYVGYAFKKKGVFRPTDFYFQPHAYRGFNQYRSAFESLSLIDDILNHSLIGKKYKLFGEDGKEATKDDYKDILLNYGKLTILHASVFCEEQEILQKRVAEFIKDYHSISSGLNPPEDLPPGETDCDDAVNECRIYSVYRHVSPSGKSYVGITKNDPEKRWGKDGSGYKGQRFYNAIKRYGWDNFTHKILESGLTEREAKAKEMEYIGKFNSYSQGYNEDIGGTTFTYFKTE